jgi:hypothetical protein
MTWLPDGKTNGMFLKKIADHGWVTENSCMSLCVTQDYNPKTNNLPFKVRYFDLTQQITKPPKALFFFNTTPAPGSIPQYPVLEPSFYFNNGNSNFTVGYNSRIVQQQLSGTNAENTTVNVKRNSKALNMNSDVRDQLPSVRREFAPIDCGNTHSNYYAAYYQNRRIKSQFCNNVSVMTNMYTGLQLLDTVTLSIVNPTQGDANITRQGQYIISGKTTYVDGVFYRELINLTSTGPNNTLDNKLVS